MALVDLAERRLRDTAVRVGLRLVPHATPLDSERALKAVSGADHILFVCLGNICRSPMAERFARRRLETIGTDVEVASAGLLDRVGRPSPPTAIEVAADFGVDLSDHRSRAVDESALRKTDVVFVMDVLNYRAIRGLAVPNDDRVFFLGALETGSRDGFEIVDPAGGDVETFTRAYTAVTAGVEAIVGAV